MTHDDTSTYCLVKINISAKQNCMPVGRETCLLSVHLGMQFRSNRSLICNKDDDRRDVEKTRTSRLDDRLIEERTLRRGDAFSSSFLRAVHLTSGVVLVFVDALATENRVEHRIEQDERRGRGGGVHMRWHGTPERHSNYDVTRDQRGQR